MAINRAALAKTLSRGSDERSTKRANLKLASTADNGGRVRRLVDMASNLMREAQTLARDKSFSDESISLKSLDVARGIDFYDEVQRFETALIKLALEESEGNQAKAARLLGLRATTLNSKIKVYDIQY